MGIRTAVKQVLIAQQDKKYEKELAQRNRTGKARNPGKLRDLWNSSFSDRRRDDWQIIRQSGSTLILQSIRKQKSSTVMKT